MRINRVAGRAAAFALLLAAGAARAEPVRSADVVELKLERYTIADGLETYFVTLKVRKGWHLHAGPVGGKEGSGSTPRFEFFLDGKRASVHDVYYPKGVVRKDGGGEYRAYEGSVACTVWLVWDETKEAKVISVTATVIATDGKTRLKESVISAEVK